MIRRAEERERFEKEMFGGPGLARFTKIVDEGELAGKGRLFNHLLLRPGEGLGRHEHRGEFEVYLVLRGEGEYDDNGVKAVIRAGDVTVCPDGEGHAVRNAGSEDLEIVALILHS